MRVIGKDNLPTVLDPFHALALTGQYLSWHKALSPSNIRPEIHNGFSIMDRPSLWEFLQGPLTAGTVTLPAGRCRPHFGRTGQSRSTPTAAIPSSLAFSSGPSSGDAHEIRRLWG